MCEARRLVGGLGLAGRDGLGVEDLTEQDATDEGVALLALEPKLARPGAIGERLVVEEVLRLLGVRQDFHSGAFFVFFGFGVAASGSVSSTGSPDSPMVSTKKSRGNWPKPSCLGYTFFASDSESGSTVATTVGISPPSVFPIWTLLRRVASSRAFLILSRSRAYERPTRIE
jgi:hypothetical protein